MHALSPHRELRTIWHVPLVPWPYPALVFPPHNFAPSHGSQVLQPGFAFIQWSALNPIPLVVCRML